MVYLKDLVWDQKRILKCHPIKSLGGGEGLDFVPGTNKKESKNG